MPELRISDIAAVPGGRRRVEVTWREGAARRAAVADLGGGAEDRDGELVRWYLEDYAESPADPAPALAASAERVLARDGADLFRLVFSGQDAAGIWERARDRLGEVRVEVDADPGNGPGLAWELLRDPGRDAAVALEAGAFVRTHLQAAGHPDLPEPSGGRLRVLLVICRPGGRDDVPFRSVASRLVRGGAERMTGLDLDVLRPATFARLSKTLRAAKAAGRPYHVVHFDGHGSYLDVADLGIGAGGNGGAHGGGIGLSPLRYGVSVAGPVRPGQHGYLLFEAPAGAGNPGGGGPGPDGAENMQLVDGPALGRLLTETGVPVLMLNACRSAYSEARSRPADDGSSADGGPADGGDVLEGDVHARIRAYGSLAAEVADAGVPGVVAMRYNVYVVTAAQFTADLYAHLLAGRSLGEAAAAARRGLAVDPGRQVGAVPVALQDWVVPVVYESAPLVLLRPEDSAVPAIRLTLGEGLPGGAGGSPGQGGGPGPDGLPRPPDPGFFGRDETLLALDRAFDAHRVVLLHAFAGAGKSSTATEFARWYRATGGLDHYPGHPGPPEPGPGPVLWSSFEHHLTADRAIGMAGDHFAEQIAGFVARLRAGEAPPEGGQDTALGRTRSLAASLGYGFARAFTEAERARLAVLHLFRDTVDVALGMMGDTKACAADAVPELAGLDPAAVIALLDRAADIGLLSPLGGGYYQIHPALPWYFTALFTATYGAAGDPAARRAARAYARAFGELGHYFLGLANSGHTDQLIGELQAEESNLLHGLDLARAEGLWHAAIGCMQALRVLYDRTGRNGEWVRLVAAIAPDVTDLATGGPLPDREDQWLLANNYRARLAKEARDWTAATALQKALVTWLRDQAPEAPAASAADITASQRDVIGNLAVSLTDLGDILRRQDDPGCLPHFQEALTLCQRIGNRQGEASSTYDLGNACLSVSGLRDLDQAERWFRHSLGLRAEGDPLGRAQCLDALARVALERFDEARAAGKAGSVLLGHLNDALRGYQDSLALIPVEDHDSRGAVENDLGNAYLRAGRKYMGEALRHYQRSVQHKEAQGDIFAAGQTRYNVAVLLAKDGRTGEALHFARAALDNLLSSGPGAAAEADVARQLIAGLERHRPR